MRSLFDFITHVSIRFRWITIAVTVALMALGIYAISLLNIELLPSIDFPSTYILARSNGATSGDLMLHTYTIPIENESADVEGVVNRESNTTTGFVFIDIRNEYGLEQDQIRADLQQMLNGLSLPVRTITPPTGMTAGDMIEDLTPEVILYLYAASLDEGSSFLPQLSSAVWRHFSPDVLGALPEAAFDEIDQRLAAELRDKANGQPQPLPDMAFTPAPALPSTWQMDRFETADDILELTGVRNLAAIFNDFLSDGSLTGPLGTVADLTPADIDTILQIEERCRESTSSNTPTPQGNDTCSMFRYLDGQAVAALLTQYGASVDGVFTEEIRLPDDYLTQMDEEDRSQIASVLTAQLLTGSRVPRQVPLPDEWRLEAPQLITFSINDIPLGIISVSVDEGLLSSEELRRLVENEIVPQLEALDLVAEVTTEGGEEIRADLLNAALEREGMQPVAAEEQETANPPASSDETTSENEPVEPDTASEPIEDGPPLPAIWATFAGIIPGLDELDTADDLLRVPGTTPSQFFNQAVIMAADNPAVGQFVNRALGDLSPDVLYYLAEHEDDFFANLSFEVLQVLSPETLSELPDEVQTRAAAAPAPLLGEFWRRLSAEPEFSDNPLATAADLAAFGGGAADTLNQVVLAAPTGLEFYAVQLINDLAPSAVDYLIAQDSAFLAQLDPQVYCYFSAEVLNIPELKEYWSDQEWVCSQQGNEVRLADIADGTAQTAAQMLLDNGEAETRIHDPEAPALPASWPGIAGFVGAEELDTADDLFYTTRNGQIRPPSALLNGFVGEQGAEGYVAVLTADVLVYAGNCDQGQLCEEGFFDKLSDPFLLMLSDEAAAGLPEEVQARREVARLGTYEPEEMVTRTNGNNSLVLQIRKESDANTVVAWSDVEQVLEELENNHPEVNFTTAFEQASYIEESINGVAREGGLGAVMAVVVILIFLNFSMRSTLVTAVSIPTSVALAFVLMKWLPGNIHALLLPVSEDTNGLAKDFLTFLLRLFPEDISLNIMTLSGLTVAIGRVVDDAIVVLENIYRNIQKGEDQLQAVLQGTRDVSLAIFAATVTTVVVFLPIGLFGGVIGAFFLPFGLAVTYALLSSFVVAITVVPLLAYLFISKSSLPTEHHSRLEHGYRQAIRWALEHRWAVMLIATIAFALGMLLLGQLPTAFLPSFGEPTITVEVNLPGEFDGVPTTIAVTDAKVRRLEAYLGELDGIRTIQTSVGSSGQSGFSSTDAVTENAATVTVYVKDQKTLDRLTPLVREQANLIFNASNDNLETEQNNVTVSGASLSEQGFGGFAVVVSGDPENPPTLADLQQYDQLIVETLDNMEGITNVESSLARITGTGTDVSQTYIRIDGIPAARYTAELETDDTIGLTQEAVDTLSKLDLPENLEVSQGFESQQQTEGFQQTFVSMAIAVLIVYFVMVLTFKSFVHPVTILFSLPLAIVGAAVGLTVTGRVLGLSSVVGLLMLVGIVVTNAIVLIDRVQTNRKMREMNTQDALIDGGATRLRPILMTAIATMVALLPLAIGLSSGAIIAAELGTVVIGGLFSSTLLTLVVVPVVYSIFDQIQATIRKRLIG